MFDITLKHSLCRADARRRSYLLLKSSDQFCAMIIKARSMPRKECTDGHEMPDYWIRRSDVRIEIYAELIS